MYINDCDIESVIDIGSSNTLCIANKIIFINLWLRLTQVQAFLIRLEDWRDWIAENGDTIIEPSGDYITIHEFTTKWCTLK